MPAPSLESALVRILRAEGELRRPVGAGFLVSPQHIITCAHVVNCAFGLPKNAADQSEAEILLDFPLLTNRPLLKAKILRWHPVKANASVGDISDIAVLELQPDIPLPIDLQPAPILALESYSSSREVKMCGFPFGVTHGTYAKGSPQGLNEKGWVEIHHLGNEIVEQGFSGTAAWATEDNAVCGMIVGILKRKHSVVAYMIPAAVLFKAFPDMPLPVNPYRGLEVFRKQDARFYFGRDEAVARLRKIAQKQPFTAVIGASGSGKSSLVFAGLMPALCQTGDWLIADCRPKKHPFLELAACLFPFLYDPELDELERIRKTKQCAAALLSEELNLSDLIRRIAEKNNRLRFLLIVDQFEELYTPNADKFLVRSFVSQLLEATQTDNFSVVITLRADFMSAAANCGVFAEALSSNQALFIPAVENSQLLQMVEQPAALQYVAFEHGLAELIVSELDSEPGNLPLLEFCLTQLWEKQQCRQITHAAYQDIGGAQQAVAVYADEIYGLFNAEDKERVRHIFLKLVRPGQGTEDTRQAATFEEFKPEYHGVIKKLADWRLLVTGQDAESRERTVEVVHEALIRHWTTLREWVDQEREFLLWRENLKMRWRQWCESSQDEGALLQGVLLDQALNWQKAHLDDLSSDLLNFINESENFREREIRAKEEAEQERERLSQETRYNLAKAFEGKALNALKTAEKGGSNKEYKKTLLLTSAALAQEIEPPQFILEMNSISSLFTKKNFQSALVEQWTSPFTNQDNLGSSSVSFSPNGRWLAYTSHDKTVCLLDAETGGQVSVLTGHDDYVNDLSFSPDSMLLASASDDKTVRIWNIKTGRMQKCLEGHGKGIWSVYFSPDGRRLASASQDKTMRLWDIETGSEVRQFIGHERDVESVCFSPCGQQLASASWDETVRFWDVATGKEMMVLRNHKSCVNSVCFSPDGRQLASSSRDKTIRLWDTKTGNELKRLEGHEESVGTVSFRPDGTMLASASSDNTVRFWNTETGKEIKRVKEYDKAGISSVNDVSFSPDGKRLAFASNSRAVQLLDTETGKRLQWPEGHIKGVKDVSFSPDGLRLASASPDNTILIWETQTGRALHYLKGHGKGHLDISGVNSVSFSPDGKRLASAAWDETVRIWDAQTGKELAVLQGHNAIVNSVSFSPNGRQLASAAHTVKIWDVETGKLSGGWGDGWGTTKVSFSPDGKRLASASRDKMVRILEPDKNTRVLKGHNDCVHDVSFSPDGSRLASASWDKTVRIWDVETGKEQRQLVHVAPVFSVSFHPNGLHLASASQDKMVRIWNTETGKELAILEGHDSSSSVSFSPDGKQLASAALVIRLWDNEIREEVKVIHKDALASGAVSHRDDINISFSPNGSG